MQLRKREGNGGSQLVTERADALLQGHGPPHQAIGGREGRITDNGQKELARPESVQDTGGIFFIGFTGALRPRLAIVPHRLAVPQAALIATAVEPFVEGLPVDPRWFHGDQETLPAVFGQVGFEGLFKAPEALPGVGKCELTTAHGGLRSHAGIVFGFAHIDANEE